MIQRIIWQGFMQGKKDGCKEWPIEGESLFSYKGEPLPYTPYGAAYERTSTYVQVGVCYLRACDSFRFSGEYVKDNVANRFWNLYETGISGGKKISERMPESTSGY